MKKLFTMFAFVTIVTSTLAQQMYNGHEYVDLGLPSGTLWATCNVGATTPEGSGNVFAWGETNAVGSLEDMKYYDNDTYEFTKYTTSDGRTKLEPEDDAATVYWGGEWRTPTTTEIQELLNECVWTWDTLNNVQGYEVANENGLFIFLPAAYGPIEGWGDLCGCYWSSSVWKYNSIMQGLLFYEGSYRIDNYRRNSCISVRPVLSGKLTAVEQINVVDTESVQKIIENGQVIIIRDGVRYNALGVRIK